MALDARRASLGGDAGRIDTAAGNRQGTNGVGAPMWGDRPDALPGRSYLDQGPSQPQGSWGSYPGVEETLGGTGQANRREQRKRLPRTLAMALMGAVATAPLAIIAGGVTTLVGTTHVIGFALIYLLVALALLAFSLACSAVVSHTGVAAGIHTYVARGLGERMGLGVGMIAVVAYNAYATAYFGIIGFELSKQISEQSGHDVPWVPIVIPFILLVGFLGTRSLRTSAIVLGVIFVVLAIAHFVFDLTALAAPSAEGISGAAVDPATLFAGSVGAAVGFSVTAYPGIETPMALGSDLKATSRQVTNATYLSIVLVGLMNVLAAWLVTVALGPDSVSGGGGDRGSDPIFDYITAHLGGAAAGLFGIFNLVGAIGAILVFHHTAARYMRSMASAGVLPAALAVRSRKGMPVRASLTQTGITAVVLIGLGVAGADPLWDVFMVLSHIASIGVFLALVITAVAVVFFLLRSDSEEGGFLGWEGRLVAAIVAVLALSAVLISALLEAHVRLGVPAGSLVVYVPPSVVLIALLVGVVWPRSRRSARSLALDEEDETELQMLDDLGIPDQREPAEPATPGRYSY